MTKANIIDLFPNSTLLALVVPESTSILQKVKATSEMFFFFLNEIFREKFRGLSYAFKQMGRIAWGGHIQEQHERCYVKTFVIVPSAGKRGHMQCAVLKMDRTVHSCLSVNSQLTNNPIPSCSTHNSYIQRHHSSLLFPQTEK